MTLRHIADYRFHPVISFLLTVSLLLLWLMGWADFFQIVARFQTWLLVPCFLFGGWTFGCIWCWNHRALHELHRHQLPRMIAVAQAQHMMHHRRQDEGKYIHIPPWGWRSLNVGAIAMGLMTAALAWLATRGWTHSLFGAELLMWTALAGYGGAWAFMGLYALVHDYGHRSDLQPSKAWFHWLIYPTSHMRHHSQWHSRYGIFPLFQVLQPAFPAYVLAMRVARWADIRRGLLKPDD